MIMLSNMTDQILKPNQSITFDSQALRTGSSAEGHRANTPEIKLRTRGIYEIHFTGNISSLAYDRDLELAIFADNEPITTSKMTAFSRASNSPVNVHADVLIKNASDDGICISIRNICKNDVIIKSDSAFWIKRVA